MLLRWFPWRLVVSRVARSKGLVDPIKLLSRLESFAQPLEVKEPLELLRAGLVFHARGLINTGAIQHNLDWIWPYWVERQYDPGDESFIPRAFSITHVNLTHRNWTAIGVPDSEEIPIVDPRGLVMPFWDGWTLDAWIASEDGPWLVPSRSLDALQWLRIDPSPAVITRASARGMELETLAEAVDEEGVPVCELAVRARSTMRSWLVISLRPYNPEGVSFVHAIDAMEDGAGFLLPERRSVTFDPRPEKLALSIYREGDVKASLFHASDRRSVRCNVGMASAAALYPLAGGVAMEARARVPLASGAQGHGSSHRRWRAAIAPAVKAEFPDPRWQFLYDASIRSIVLHSPRECYPGPYTYKRFWFRDAAFILHALLCAGLTDRAERVIDHFPSRQTRTGFFLSQEGEWDSNGEALWTMRRYCELTGRPPKRAWLDSIRVGAEWIERKRVKSDGSIHAGLLPPGFSAEHLGPNDYYYWDDFWGVAGLQSAAVLLRMAGELRAAGRCDAWGADLLAAVRASLEQVEARLRRPAMPASPYRRLDTGAIGSLASGYPLQIFDARDPHLLDTAAYIASECLVGHGFFQDIIHSGVNCYLTLHLAQVRLRAGDTGGLEQVREIARLASPTGQWPEAVHPRTGGGCMGDGHHVWASADWFLMMRNSFLREEGGALVVGAGVLPEWLEQRKPIRFGPAPTSFGPVTIEIDPCEGRPLVHWSGVWRDAAPMVEIRLPGYEAVNAASGQDSVSFARSGAVT
ncbi:MAG: hypothetical protein HYU52_09140 [Acidobacteria bacterium]|nr:hypothetical protein [Acidobacteriota bacterium]